MQPPWTGSSHRPSSTQPLVQGGMAGSAAPPRQFDTHGRAYRESYRVKDEPSSKKLSHRDSHKGGEDVSGAQEKVALKDEVSKFTALRDEYDRELSVQKEWRSKVDLEMKRLLEYIAVVKNRDDDNRQRIDIISQRAREDNESAQDHIRSLEQKLQELHTAEDSRQEQLKQATELLEKEKSARLADEIRMSEKLEAKTTEVEALQDEAENREQDLGAHKRKLDELAAQLAAAEEEFEASKAKIDEMNATLETTQSLRIAAEKRAEESESRAAENAEAVTSLQDALRGEKAAGTAIAAEQAAQRKRLEEEMEKIAAALTTEQEHVQTTRANAEALAKVKNDLEEELRSVKAERLSSAESTSQELRTLEFKLQAATERAEKDGVAAAEQHSQQVESLESTISRLSAELQAAQATMDEREREVNSLGTTVAELRAVVATLESRTAGLGEDVVTKSAAIEDLVASHNGVVAQLEAKLHDALQCVANAESNLSEVQSASHEAQSTMTAEKDAVIAELDGQVQELREALSSKGAESSVALQQITQELTIESQRRLKQVEEKLKESGREIDHWKAEFYRVSAEAATAAASAAMSSTGHTYSRPANDGKSDGYYPKHVHPRSPGVATPESYRAKRIRNEGMMDLNLSPIGRPLTSTPPPARSVSSVGMKTPTSSRSVPKDGISRTPKASTPQGQANMKRRPLRQKSAPAEGRRPKVSATSPLSQGVTYSMAEPHRTPTARKPSVQRRQKVGQTPRTSQTPKIANRTATKKAKPQTKPQKQRTQRKMPSECDVSMGDPSDVFAF